MYLNIYRGKQMTDHWIWHKAIVKIVKRRIIIYQELNLVEQLK